MRGKLSLPILAFAAVLILQLEIGWAQTCGSAYFSDEINWEQNPTLYYTVAGAPASTCGDVWVSRNGGAYQETAGWICTDGSGNATKGPWYHGDQADDETAYAFVEWVTSSGTCYSPTKKHIWDVGPPTAQVTSSCPSSFSGTASDEAWGAGFHSDWDACWGAYYNSTTNRWWHPSTGSYSETETVIIGCTCSGMPSMNITWSCSSKPSSHVSGHNYTWYAWVWDIGQMSAPATCSFTY